MSDCRNLLINGFTKNYSNAWESGWLSASLRIDYSGLLDTLARFRFFTQKPKAISLKFNLPPHMNEHSWQIERNEETKNSTMSNSLTWICVDHIRLVKNYKSYSSVKLSIRDEYGSIWMKRFLEIDIRCHTTKTYSITNECTQAVAIALGQSNDPKKIIRKSTNSSNNQTNKRANKKHSFMNLFWAFGRQQSKEITK